MSGTFRKVILDGQPSKIVAQLVQHQGAYLSLKLVDSVGGGDADSGTAPVVIDVYGKYKLIHENPHVFHICPEGAQLGDDDEGVALICGSDTADVPVWGLVMRLFPAEQRCVNIDPILADGDLEKHKDEVLRSEKTSIQRSINVGLKARADRFYLSVWLAE